ncbi:Hypothetical protein FKW44_004102, partial [Caligus rogercresseyi]
AFKIAGRRSIRLPFNSQILSESTTQHPPIVNDGTGRQMPIGSIAKTAILPIGIVSRRVASSNAADAYALGPEG